MITKKKIKILFAVGRLSVGGAEKLLVKKLENINTDKFEPYLLTLFPEQKDSFAAAVQLPASHWAKFNFQSLWNLPQWRKLFFYLRQEKFDAVVTSLFSANLIVRMAAIAAGIPVIIAYEHNLYPNKRRWQIWADWFLAKWTKKIIVDSEIVRQFTARQEKIPIEKILTLYIPPLLDPAAMKNPELLKKQFPIPENAKIILTVSRLVEEKGHRYLIEAAKKILDQNPDAYFIIVGWGPLEQNLKEQIRQAGLDRRVLLPGRMDIQEILPLADIYADPAVMTDLPVAIMEAMRLGKPVVASDIGEIGVFVKNRESGFLVPAKDPAALADRINALLQNSELTKQMGRTAAEIVANYSLENYLKNFEDLVSNFSKK